MKLRVKYDERFHCWFGEEYDDLLGSWYSVTDPCYTKWGAKRELRSWYKHYGDPSKIEEIDIQKLMHKDSSKILKSICDGSLVLFESMVLFHMGYSISNWEWWLIISLTICYRLLAMTVL
ncbi:hypothetical protein [[Ruminococcus] lactaris]|uniref:hypothetical protein n=1 Tax=[Ruminococcus] lactaris TaxID=46228 RepID=UPI003FD7A595